MFSTNPNFLITGDIHAKFVRYAVKLHRHVPENSIVVGDFGLEFVQNPLHVSYLYSIMEAGNHKYFRGNHDNPAVVNTDPQCLPDVDVHENMMWVAGAYSVDKAIRKPGIDWWPDEELSYEEFEKAIDRYHETKPEIMLSHDAPFAFLNNLFYSYRARGWTTRALDSMFSLHKPRVWIFGHHHMHLDIVMDGCRFVCLSELQSVNLNIQTMVITKEKGRERITTS